MNKNLIIGLVLLSFLFVPPLNAYAQTDFSNSTVVNSSATTTSETSFEPIVETTNIPLFNQLSYLHDGTILDENLNEIVYEKRFFVSEDDNMIQVQLDKGKIVFNKESGASTIFDNDGIVIKSDSYVARASPVNTDNWFNLSVNDSPVSVTVEESDHNVIVTFTQQNNEGIFDLETIINNDNSKTTAKFTNLLYENHKFAFTETLQFPDNLIKLNLQDIDLNLYVGQSFPREVLEENMDLVLEVKEVYFNAGMGFDYLWQVNIQDDSKITLDWANVGETITAIGQTVELDPTYSFGFGSFGYTSGGQFWGAMGIDIDSNGYIYVADKNNYRVQVFDSSGNYVGQIGLTRNNGSSTYQFDKVNDVHIDANDKIYVADSGNARVQIYGSWASGWNHIATLGQNQSFGSGNNQFNQPFGIGTDNTTGKIYVADYYNHRVQVFDSSYNYIATIGSSGSGNGQFNRPISVDIDHTDTTNHIFVTDRSNHRVQVFDSSYNHVYTIGGYGSGNGQFSSPNHVGVDVSTSELYVADYNNHRIQIFDSTNGNYIGQYGSYGSGNGQFYRPAGVEANSNYLYVAEEDNNRVQVFQTLVAPPTPTNVSATQNTSTNYNTVDVAWTGDVTATSYDVYKGGSNIGTVTIGSNSGGNAWDFSGSGKGLVGGASTWNFLHNPTLSSTGGITVNAWIDGTNNSAQAYILNTAQSSSSVGVWYYLDTNGALSYITPNGTGNTTMIMSPNGAVTSGWHMISMVFDSSNNTGIIYVDGVAQSTTVTFTSFSTSNPYHSSMAIGNFSQFSGNNLDSIDDLSIWQRTLTSSEITSLYNSGLSSISDSKLSAYYDFESTTLPNLSTSSDSLGSSANGTNSGASTGQSSYSITLPLATTFTDTSAPDSSNLSYTVDATNSVGTSSQSSAGLVETFYKPNAPTNLSDGGANVPLILNWTASTVNDVTNSNSWTWDASQSSGIGVTGNTATNTNSGNGWNTYIRTVETINASSGGGEVSYKLAQGTTNSQESVGFGKDPLNANATSYNNIEYAMTLLNTTTVQIWESGAHQGNFTISGFNAGTSIFKIMMDSSGTVTFYHNGTLLRTSPNTASGDYYVHSAIYTVGSSVELLPYSVTTPSPSVTGYKIERDDGSGFNTIVSNTQPVSGLVGHFGLDGNTDDMTWTGTETYVTGEIGNGASFNGSSEVVLANEPNFDFDRTDPFSVSFWLKNGNTSQDLKSIISKYDDLNNQGWGMYYRAPYDIHFQMVDTDSTNEYETRWQNMSANQSNWNHYTVTWDGTLATLYQNGSDQSSAQNTFANTLTGTTLNNHPVVLSGVGGGYSVRNFTGDLDDVKIYDRELTSTEVSQLYNHDTYSDSNALGNVTYRISGINPVGTGVVSATHNAFGGTVPDAPSNLTTTQTAPFIHDLSWTVPGYNGGVPITNYNVYRDGSLLTTLGNVTSYQDNTMQHIAHTHMYEVSAVNSIGEGPKSNQSTITSWDVPAVVTGVVATAQVGSQIQLDWNIPNNGGTAITGYRIQSSIDNITFTDVVASTTIKPYIHTGLTNGVVYYYKISAINVVGEGATGSAQTIVGDIPDTPSSMTVVPQAGAQITITIAIPNDNGYSISAYGLQRSSDNFTTFTNLTAQSSNVFVDQNLVIGTSYQYKATATNSLGTTPFSVASVSTIAGDVPSTPTAPGAVVNTT